MDWGGLLKFVNAKRKESQRLRSQMPDLLAEAIYPSRLVVDAVEEFVMKYGPADKRWSCEMLVHALFYETSLNSKAKGTTLIPKYASSVSGRAEKLLQLWKRNIEDGGGGGGGFGPAEAVMFLELAVIFNLASKFDQEFLKKLVLDFASRRDVAKLAPKLGFGDIAGIIDELLKKGKEIEAVHFATFQSLQEESSSVELSTIKAVLKCVEDLKLEVEFPLDNLRRRASTLDNAKAQKKKNLAPPPTSSKSLGKKSPFGGGGGGGGRGGGSRGGQGVRQPPRPAKTARYAPPNHQT